MGWHISGSSRARNPGCWAALAAQGAGSVRAAAPALGPFPAATGPWPQVAMCGQQPMMKTYADLLREARAEIREVTPREADRLRSESGAAVVDVREDG